MSAPVTHLAAGKVPAVVAVADDTVDAMVTNLILGRLAKASTGQGPPLTALEQSVVDAIVTKARGLSPPPGIPQFP